MARIIYSALVTKIAGSIGGTTFQSNRYGFTVKQRSNVVRPRSPLQTERKIYFSAATKAWQTLSDTEKAAFNNYANTRPQFAKNNPTAQLTGFAIFVKWHCLYMLWQGSISVLPTISGTYSTLDAYSVLSLIYNPGYLGMTINWVNDTGSHRALFFISRPFRPSENFVGTKLRYLMSIPNSDTFIDIHDLYVSIWGVSPVPGDRLALEVVQIENSQPFIIGRSSQIFTVVPPG